MQHRQALHMQCIGVHRLYDIRSLGGGGGGGYRSVAQTHAACLDRFHQVQTLSPGGGGGGVVAPSFGSVCETDCESGGGDEQR